MNKDPVVCSSDIRVKKTGHVLQPEHALLVNQIQGSFLGGNIQVFDECSGSSEQPDSTSASVRGAFVKDVEHL